MSLSRSLHVLIAGIMVAGGSLSPLTIEPADAARKKVKIQRAVRLAACNPGTFHSEARVGARCCFSDGHSHYGAGDTEISKERAMMSAARAWSSFTVWEYGRSYGNASIAIAKNMQCSGGGRAWTCSFEATPCR